MKFDSTKYKANEILRILREWTELTQKEFGKTINRSENSIASYERSRYKISFNKVLEIADKHGIKITFEKIRK